MSRPTAGKERDEALERFGRWVKETCDLFGASPVTGFRVAGILTENLAVEWAEQDARVAE